MWFEEYCEHKFGRSHLDRLGSGNHTDAYQHPTDPDLVVIWTYDRHKVEYLDSLGMLVDVDERVDGRHTFLVTWKLESRLPYDVLKTARHEASLMRDIQRNYQRTIESQREFWLDCATDPRIIFCHHMACCLYAHPDWAWNWDDCDKNWLFDPVSNSAVPYDILWFEVEGEGYIYWQSDVISQCGAYGVPWQQSASASTYSCVMCGDTMTESNIYFMSDQNEWVCSDCRVTYWDMVRFADGDHWLRKGTYSEEYCGFRSGVEYWVSDFQSQWVLGITDAWIARSHAVIDQDGCIHSVSDKGLTYETCDLCGENFQVWHQPYHGIRHHGEYRCDKCGMPNYAGPIPFTKVLLAFAKPLPAA